MPKKIFIRPPLRLENWFKKKVKAAWKHKEMRGAMLDVEF